MNGPSPAVESIGIVSDTHFQERLFEIPDCLAEVWSGVKLILHAGDVGDPQVLNLLGRIAPVEAVHGNDDPDGVKRLLPETRVILLGGHRVLLWHSHHPDPAEEQSGRDDFWGRKWERIARRGMDAGADIVVYGHTHVPMFRRCSDILLANPGALASGSFFTRQAVPSVGRLNLLDDGRCIPIHFDARTGRPMEFPQADPGEAFTKLGNTHQEWLVEPELLPGIDGLRAIRYKDIRSVVRAVIPQYRRILEGGVLRRDSLVACFRDADGIDPWDRQQVLAVLEKLCRPS